jgi:glyoxylase-like metal-dependent hydrolase (beta-lactamase superfamily II)
LFTAKRQAIEDRYLAMNEALRPAIRVTHQTPYLISFYAGREPYERIGTERNWFDDSAMALGTAMYAVHSGGEAVVYDTFASNAQAAFVRNYLARLGVRKFTVVLSHWHLDHIAGNGVFADCPIVATVLTHAAMTRHKADIEAGNVWGPPEIKPLVFPNILFDESLQLRAGEIAIELRRRNIHSIDGCVAYLPRDKLLLAGDTLEDPLTYMIEVENLAEHVRELKEMKRWDVAKILPNHGDPDVIARGGFDTSLIDAAIAYVTRVLGKAHDADFLQGTMEDYIGPETAKGFVHPVEPYREVHAQNLKLVYDYWKNKPLPAIEG